MCGIVFKLLKSDTHLLNSFRNKTKTIMRIVLSENCQMFLEYLSSVCNNRHIASIAAVKSWIRFGQYNKTAGNTMISDRQWVGLDTADNNKAWVGSTESERGGLDTDRVPLNIPFLPLLAAKVAVADASTREGVR